MGAFVKSIQSSGFSPRGVVPSSRAQTTLTSNGCFWSVRLSRRINVTLPARSTMRARRVGLAGTSSEYTSIRAAAAMRARR
jgi:hypothetical protein